MEYARLTRSPGQDSDELRVNKGPLGDEHSPRLLPPRARTLGGTNDDVDIGLRNPPAADLAVVAEDLRMETMPKPQLQDPYRIAPDTWVIPEIVPAGPETVVPVNSMVITGTEPVIVDTGNELSRGPWLDAAFGLVEPADVRWVVPVP